MPTSNLKSADTPTPNTTLWLPPLSPKAQHQVDRYHRRQRRPNRPLFGFRGKTVWDYLNLLAVLAIPVLIAAGTLWFTDQQSQATAAASQQQHQTDLSIAQDQQQEAALQAYLDRMSDLLLNEHLVTSLPGDEVRQVARARTLTLLPQINGRRKGEVIRFLYEARLIGYSLQGFLISTAPVDLSGADLHGADLSGAVLSGIKLSGTDFHEANLGGATLIDATLIGTNLGKADLRNANLSHAALDGANLSESSLKHANLYDADLSMARLFEARDTTVSQLNAASSLAGAVLPDGSIHP